MKSFWKDSRRKDLLAIKILMFLTHAGQATLYPYFPVHLKSLGIPVAQTAIIFALQPFIGLFEKPFVRILVDRFGSIRLLLFIFLMYSAITCLGLTFIPVVDTKTTRNDLNFSMKCSLSNFTYFYLFTNNSCSVRNSSYLDHLVLKITNCSTNCSSELVFPNTIDFCFVNFDTEAKYCGKLTGNMILTFEISNLVNSIKFDKLPRNILVDMFKGNITYGGTQYRNLICDSANKLFLFKGCHISCDIRSAVNVTTCVNASETRYSRTFWMYLAIRFSVSLGIAILNGLFDVASTVIVKELDADVGYQHMWQAVAVCLFAPISGGLVDLLSAGKDIKDYRPCFYLYSTLYTTGAFVSLFVDFSPKLSSKNSFEYLKILLSKPEINVMLFYVLILGISWGFLENFLFWFLESEVNSPTFLLGVCLTISAGTSIPMTIFSTWITKNIGCLNATIVAFIAYVIRFIGYSYAYNPYICLFYGTLENFTLTLSAVGIMLYCYHLVPLKTIDTMKILWISTHFIMGRSLGSFSGGYFINLWGFRKTLRVYSYICAGMSGFCYLVNLFYLRNKNNDSQNKQEKWKRVLKITGVFSHQGFLEVPTFGSLVLTNVCTNSVSFILSVNKRCHTYILPHKSLQMKDRQSHNLSSTCSYTSPYSEKHHHIHVVSPRSLQVKDRRSHSLPCSILYLKKHHYVQTVSSGGLQVKDRRSHSLPWTGEASHSSKYPSRPSHGFRLSLTPVQESDLEQIESSTDTELSCAKL